MQHFGEVFAAEIYARNAIVVGDVKRGKEVLKPWVSSGGSFGTFLSLLKEKYEHSRKKTYDYPSVFLLRKNPVPLTRGAEALRASQSSLHNKKHHPLWDGAFFSAKGQQNDDACHVGDGEEKQKMQRVGIVFAEVELEGNEAGEGGHRRAEAADVDTQQQFPPLLCELRQ